MLPTGGPTIGTLRVLYTAKIIAALSQYSSVRLRVRGDGAIFKHFEAIFEQRFEKVHAKTPPRVNIVLARSMSSIGLKESFPSGVPQ